MASPRRKPSVPAPSSPDNAARVPEGRRPCPICQKPMQTVKNEEETVDLCAEHGVWLDRYELERMFARRAQRSGSRRTREVAEARAEGRWDWFFWALFLSP